VALAAAEVGAGAVRAPERAAAQGPEAVVAPRGPDRPARERALQVPPAPRAPLASAVRTG